MHIDSYSFGEIVIDGNPYDSDVMLYQGQVKEWWRRQGHSLELEDLKWLLEQNPPPEVIVVGRGRYGVMEVPDEVARALKERGIELIAKPTKEACEEFNRLAGTRRVAGAFHLTC